MTTIDTAVFAWLVVAMAGAGCAHLYAWQQTPRIARRERRLHAVTALLAATQDAIAAAERSAAPAAHYELRAAGALVALIQTGTDEHGDPDYAATSALIQRIAAT